MLEQVWFTKNFYSTAFLSLSLFFLCVNNYVETIQKIYGSKLDFDPYFNIE